MTTSPTTTADILYDAFGYVLWLTFGVRCGNHRWAGEKVYHNSAAAVRACYRQSADELAQQAGELAAEAAVERHFEDRGYWEARAQEDYERANGMVDFQTAWDMACPERVVEREQAEATWADRLRRTLR